eukprot:5022328-Lingulodinium_polyedra.AAC.1
MAPGGRREACARNGLTPHRRVRQNREWGPNAPRTEMATTHNRTPPPPYRQYACQPPHCAQLHAI